MIVAFSQWTCDRCSYIYSRPPRVRALQLARATHKWGKLSAASMSDGPLTTPNADICPACVESFTNWWTTVNQESHS